MDTTLTLTPKAVAAVPFVAQAQGPVDQVVPIVKELDGAPTLPADKVFVAQVVTARLSGTDFPENPAEIAPPERTLRPYDIPMLPADQEEPVFGSEEPEEESKASSTQNVNAADQTEERDEQPEQSFAKAEAIDRPEPGRTALSDTSDQPEEGTNQT